MEDLLNKNNWSKIFKLIKNNKFNLLENKIIQAAAAANKSIIIRYVLKNNLNLLEKINPDGNTCIHTMAQYNYTDLLKYCIDKNPDFIKLLNNSGENILLILYNNFEFIKYILSKNLDLDIILNISDTNNNTLLTKNINNYKILNLLLNTNKIKLDIPKNNPVIIQIIKNNNNKTINLFLKYIQKNKIDLNLFDSGYLTPFLWAVKNKNYGLIKKLIKLGININYSGQNMEYNPLLFAVYNSDEEILDILLDNNFNINLRNNNLETALHIILSKNTKINYSIFFKLLFYADLNLEDLKGTTPLHLICQKLKFKNLDKILGLKLLDIFKLDKNNKRPLDYIPLKNLYDFLIIVVKSYACRLPNSHYKLIFKPDLKYEIRLDILKKYIFETKRSIANKLDYKNIIRMVNINKLNNNIGLFNSNSVHNIIYTIILLKKYNNLLIPYQYFIPDKYNTDIKKLDYNLYFEPNQQIIPGLIKIYTESLFEITPYLIIWKNQFEYYLDKNLEFYLSRILSNNKIRFIFFKLTIITDISETSHANIIIFDKNKKILERFEPYGIINFLETKKLDGFIKNNIGLILKKYYNQKIIYLSPEKLFMDIGFQIISQDMELSVKKYGDPAGYCLAWTYWYLELRLINPDINPKKLIKYSMDKIINNKIDEPKKLFINYIRDYAHGLDQQKNLILLTCKITNFNLYNLVISKYDQKKLFRYLSQEFNKIINRK